MKPWQFITTLAFLLGTGAAIAGFRHPIEQSGEEAIAIQKTPVAPTAPAMRMMPDRMVEMQARQPQATPTTRLPAQVKGAPAPAPEAYGPAMPKSLRTAAPTSTGQDPVAKAPALPSAPSLQIPGVLLPGDGRLPMATARPDALSLKGANRALIHNFLRQARSLPVPSREYGTEVRSRAIAERYHAALHPTPGLSFRTQYKLALADLHKFGPPPAAIHYENMVKRIDALFDGVAFHYPKATVALWQLAQTPANPKPLQARDALFAGIMSERAGWETAASNHFEESAMKRVDRQERYVRILWRQLDRVNNPVHVDRVVARVNPYRARLLAQEGDKANYAMAKRMFYSPEKAENEMVKEFQNRVADIGLRERLELLKLLAKARSAAPEDKDAAIVGLGFLESQGSPQVQGEARLALARTLLQRGRSPEALAMYQRVEKDGRNRLEVVAEQTYAEYLTGNYQDSLGKTVGLQSPYFQYGFAPDVHLVEILSRKSMCDFGGAEIGVKRFADRYVPELQAIEATLSRKPEPAAYYEELIGFHALEKPMRFQRYAMHIPTVMENQKTLNQAVADLEKIDSLGTRTDSPIVRPSGWDGYAADMRQRWGTKAAELRRESAAVALNEMAYLAKRLRHTFAQVELLDLDISTGATKNYNLQSAMNFPVRKPAEAELDKSKLKWPFEDEIWEDEIDFLKMKNPSKCAITTASVH